MLPPSPASPPLVDLPLLDVHAHFHTPASNRSDWQRYNDARLEAGDRIGVRCHVASVLGSWGATSPTYFSSPRDQSAANRWMLDFADQQGPRVRAYVAVNPNFTAHALAEITRGVADGAVGIKLAAGRKADDALLDDIAAAAAEHDLPVLQHVWQHRQREWPGQDASDAVELARLAARHPRTRFLLAHIGGGGDYMIAQLLTANQMAATLPPAPAPHAGGPGMPQHQHQQQHQPRTTTCGGGSTQWASANGQRLLMTTAPPPASATAAARAARPRDHEKRRACFNSSENNSEGVPSLWYIVSRFKTCTGNSIRSMMQWKQQQ